MENYINGKKEIYNAILEFLENSDDENCEQFDQILYMMKSQEPDETREFLQIINSISDHHHRDINFIKRIHKILQYYQNQIKKTLSNIEIFHIFKSNKLILLFLLENCIIKITSSIYHEMIYNGNFYINFFYPELEKFLQKSNKKVIKSDVLPQNPNILENFDEKRHEGENDSYICTLIRQDSVVEFISYVNKNNYSLSSRIAPSIFETNSFLIKHKNTSLIEYSAFFGSIQIFRYLMMNKVELTSTLWLYTIHSNNAELIHLLESNIIVQPKFMIRCFIESIKCHHNEIADYIENNLINQRQILSTEKEKNISKYLKYHNYAYIQEDIFYYNVFLYLYIYHYDKLFDILIKKKEEENKNCLTQLKKAENNKINDIYYYLKMVKEIPKTLFCENTVIKEIIIPSSVVKIKDSAFYNCSSLQKVVISSSVQKIGRCCFYGCSSLTEVWVSPNVKSIKDGTFQLCKSLKKISIPLVTYIGSHCFEECTSLTEISIPLSVTQIGRSAFRNCKSLKEITIPSSVTIVSSYAFFNCVRLEQITIQSKIKRIGNHTFDNCLSLKQFAIPSSVTSIGRSAFQKCESLKKMTIPLSVTSVGSDAFWSCCVKDIFIIPSESSIRIDDFINFLSREGRLFIHSSFKITLLDQ